ncbi:telomerase protein component 1, partial [Plakobranchus ocellatus]
MSTDKSKLSTTNPILNQLSKSKNTNQFLLGHSSVLESKQSFKKDKSKLSTNLASTSALNVRSNPLFLPSSTLSTTLSLKGPGLLQQSKLTSSLLKNPKEGLTGHSLLSHSTINSSLARLSLKTDLAREQAVGKKIKQTDVSTRADMLQQKSSEKSLDRKRRLKSSVVTSKKKIVEGLSKEVAVAKIKEYTMEPPHYSIKYDREYELEDVKKSSFVLSLPYDQLSQSIGKSTDVAALKRSFINCVSGSLIAQPNLTDKNDLTRQQLSHHVHVIQQFDPEFVLKVALYSRKELGIRTTSNFLLALAANYESTRQYLKKYFCMCIALPSDWIEVAKIFQTLDENNLKIGSLPAALRKVMTTKFAEFDEYQLAKYNKESSGKKKKAKEKKAEAASKIETKASKLTGMGRKASKRNNFFDSDSSDSDEESSAQKGFPLRQLSSVSYDEKVSEEVLKNQSFTIKQLIRKLHIKEPVQYVMSIIGKKYPLTSEEFYQKRLPGIFDETKAGKRMKLAVPETWETQVSLKGNNAKTWEDLIDHKKLPFMAMLRNLRNLIKSGISMKHHNSILHRLCDQRSVVNSKQFPFRFFSAYVALTELEESYEKNQRDIIDAAVAQEQSGISMGGRGRGRGAPGRGRGAQGRGRGARGSLRGLGIKGGGVQKVASSSNRRGFGKQSKQNTESQWWLWKKMKKEGKNGNEIKEVSYDKNLIQRYRKALDTAVKIATVHNVQPIKGRTILLCDIGRTMDRPCSSARGLGKPRTLKEISVLMGLMCKYSCEECEFIVFDENGCEEVQLQPGTILDNMDVVLNSKLPVSTNEMISGVPYSVLLEKLRDKIEVDNLLIFGEDFYPDMEKGVVVNDFLRNYRHMVNPNLLFVSVTFSSAKTGFALNVDPRHHNDVYISGYSDALLRFVAERGDSSQMNHVEKIDVAFQLCPVPNKNKASHRPQNLRLKIPAETGMLKLTTPTPSWRTVRIFISSTFRDMHGERDLLTRFIFPELRALARRMFINVYEVDLRWGITEEQSKENSALEICLQEVSRCQLFLGLLGERYGWTPDSNQVPDTSEFDWVRSYAAGASVTELEIQLGALSKVGNSRDTAFFFIRDNSFEKSVPAPFLSDFVAESETHKSRLANLKQRVRSSGLEVHDGYPCHWGGFVAGKPIVAGLEDFGAKVLNTLMNAVKKLCPKQDETITEDEHNSNLQWAYVESLSDGFVGRKDLVKDVISKILCIQSGILCISGKMGTGKTALMAFSILQYTKLKHVGGSYGVFLNFAGSAPGSVSVAATVRRLAQQLNTRFGLGHNLPEDFQNLIFTLKYLLEEAAAICPSRLVIFLDGTDEMDKTHQPCSLDWLPSPLPDNVVVVITALEGNQTHKSCKRLQAHEISMPGLQNWDKAELVRSTLAKHRKSLSESGFGNQIQFLMLKKEAANPLYLKLACEELRVFGIFEKVSEKLKEMPHTTSYMLQAVLARLEDDHGVEIMSSVLCLLICARNGLYPEELYELITWSRMISHKKLEPTDIINMNLDMTQAMTPLGFTYLIRSMACFLNPSLSWSPLLTLSNREVHMAIKLRYMKGSDTSLELHLHKLLAAFFRSQADPLKNGTWQSKNIRSFQELPYHLAESGQLKDLEEILCDHRFIQAKCNLGMAAKLLEDFSPQVSINNRLLEKKLASSLSSQRFQEYKSFVVRNMEILSSCPALEWQQAINEPAQSLPYKDAASLLTYGNDVPSYMEWSSKPQDVSECYLTLSSFKKPATSVDVSPCSTMFATGSQDMLVRLYSMVTGKEITTFTGHSDLITDVCFVGSSLLCSASADCSLSLWDVENQHRIFNLRGHSRRVNSCASDQQGKLVASGSWDCTVIVWNVKGSGNKLCSLDIG